MKFQARFLTLAALVLTSAVSSTVSAKEVSLYDRYYGKTVKVYVAPVTDVTSEKVVNAEALQAKITEALQTRNTIKFVPVAAEADADMVIRTEVAEFMWTDSDPIDMLMGVGGAAMDAAVTEDYARLQANMTVADVKKQKDLWSNRVMATITKKPMSQAESVPLVTEDFAKTFVRKAFSRPKK